MAVVADVPHETGFVQNKRPVSAAEIEYPGLRLVRQSRGRDRRLVVHAQALFGKAAEELVLLEAAQARVKGKPCQHPA